MPVSASGKSGGAKGAFGEPAADDPLAAAAAGAMIALVRPVDGVIAAPRRIVRENAVADALGEGRHRSFSC